MLILADQNIPFAKQAFTHLGEVKTFVGRELSAKDVAQADVLLVRSVTKVNDSLLAGSKVKFIASATIGTDHVDLDNLQQQGISFANAPGSNATSAAEYVLAALLEVASQQKLVLDKLQVGIVGYGNVGSRVANLFEALGLQCQIYDPPRQQHFADRDYCDWQTICTCELVTAHVPLTHEGDYPTYRMFDATFFRGLKPGAVFINTARGEAVDEAALLQRLESSALHLVLDVWQNEPRINPQLVRQTLISTPHIAGYAYDGKLRGTEMIYQAACRYFSVKPQWSMQAELNEANTPLSVTQHQDLTQLLLPLVRQAYSITEDSDRLRMILNMDATQAAAHFDELRKHYPKRREFSHYTVDVSQLPVQQQRIISRLGFE